MQVKYEFECLINSMAAGVIGMLEDYQKAGWECISITNRPCLYGGNEFVIFFRRPLP